MKHKILRVTMTVDYHIPMYDEEKSRINGWTIEQIIEDWFKRGEYLISYHATRDAHQINGSKKYIDSEIAETFEDDNPD